MRIIVFLFLSFLQLFLGSGKACSQIGTQLMSPNDSSSNGITEVSLGYYFDTFSTPYERYWQIYSAGTRLDLPFGPLIPGVNMGRMNRGSLSEGITNSFQFVAESYPTLSPKVYSYFMYGYSQGRYFPTHRAAATVWVSLENGWVIAGGTNYFLFDNAIFVPHLSLEKYLANYWLSGRINIHKKATGLTSSLFLTARRYHSDSDYIQFTVGAGTAPDEPYDILSDLDRQKAVSFRLLYNTGLGDRLVIKAGAGYSREDYGLPDKRNRVEGLVSLTYKTGKQR